MQAVTIRNQDLLAKLSSEQNVWLDACPICGHADWSYFGGRDHFGMRVEYWICAGCCLVGQAPRLNERALIDFYSNSYRELYQSSATPTDEEFEFQCKRGRNLLQIMTGAMPASVLERILDMGCSAGGLLTVARSEFQAKDTVGVELDVAYGNLARDRGVTVFTTLEEVQKAGAPLFDAITMSHVLEHLVDIRGVIKQLHSLLKKNGTLCIEVPHSCEGACFEIAHLWGFNEASLSRLLAESGFVVEHIETHGRPRSPQRPNLYLAAIARKSESGPGTIPKPNAYDERMRRYKIGHEGVTSGGYNFVVLKNTMKQMLGKEKNKLVANSWNPTSLRKHQTASG